MSVIQDKRGSLWFAIRNYLWIGFLALCILGLILWAGVTVWDRSCRPMGEVNCPSLILDLEPLILALVIWLIGLLVRMMDRKGMGSTLFLLCAGALAVGKLSAMGSDMGGRFFYILLAWLSPRTFYFHHALLNRPPRRLGQIVLGGLYGLAILETLPFLLWSVRTLELQGEFYLLRLGIRMELALAFGLGWALFFRDYGHTSRMVQQRIRLTVFGTLFAAAPLLLLSLLPETLGASVYLPYEWTLPCLILAPLIYAYALFRRRLPNTEATFNRLSVYYLAITLLLSLYLALATLLNYVTDRPSHYWPLGSALLGVGLVLLFAPLQRWLQHLMAWILYGGEIHYSEVIGRLSEALALALDREALHRLLLTDWPRAMRLSMVIALLRDSDGFLATLGLGGEAFKRMDELYFPTDGPLATYLKKYPAPIPDRQVHQFLSQTSLGREEAILFALPGIAYWLPLVSGGELQGLLLIGRQADDDPFSAEDEQILATLAHQAGIAAHNVRLIEEIRLARQELARAHRQLLLEQDQSQREIALELHDQGIQELVGILFQLNEMEQDLSRVSAVGVRENLVGHLAATLRNVKDETQSLVTYLRRLIYDLHPPGLEEMGLTLALESYANHLKDQNGPTMPYLELHMDKIGPTDLSLPLATTLFRAAQEALRNALQHSCAQHILLGLHHSRDQIVLYVKDDGCGFRVPARLSELAGKGHYGLMGMAERIAWAGGELDIKSQPGQGTDVGVQIPLDPEVEGQKDGEKTIA